MNRFRRSLCGVLLFCTCTFAESQELQAVVRGDVELPDAPSFVASGGQAAGEGVGSGLVGTGRLSGEVLDINGGVVPGATVTLVEMGGAAIPGSGIVVTSDGAGRFSFDRLPAGRLKFTITAAGLETFVSSEIVLKAGEVRAAPQIALPIATTTADVQVTVTQVELAQEQIKMEEKQRVFGVLPNFYSSYIWNAAPLTKGQKFGLGMRSVTDPTDFLGAALTAGIEYQAGTFPGYGYGAAGYAKRFAAAYGDGAITRMMGSAVLPVLLHQDPRYFYKGSGTKKSRAWYAITRAVITRGDDGRAEPNYSHIGGAFIGGAIANAYHPAANRGIGLTLSNGAIDTAGNAVQNLLREFLLRDLTPKVPDYAKGQAESGTAAAKP